MSLCVFLLLVLLALPAGQFIVRPVPAGATGLSVGLTVQEAIYPGSTAGVARTNEPVTVGIPLPDDVQTGATGVTSMSLSGTTVGQFRVLGTWPSGRAKWVLVDTQLGSLTAGGTSTALTLINNGSGNFGGSTLASDNGATITVATGSATFTIKKANFNGFDRVVVGSTTVVNSGASVGLVVIGPTFNNTTCGTCATVYSSANDEDSTCSIEENGPVRAVLKCTGGYDDASNNEYLKFTVRMHFYKGKSYVKAQTTLRNADLGADNSFAVAYKGIAANEWRVTANISGTQTYTIAKESGVAAETGTISGTDDIYLYSAESLLMKDPDWCGGDCVAFTADTGWDIRKNSVSLDTGTNTVAQAVGGWADINDTNGVGMSIGVYQMAAYWPKSLEFASGGSEVRIGIWPRQNSRTYHQAWPQWSTHDLYFNFHDAALSSPADEFLKFQHPLIGRAAYTHYNSSDVFSPYNMVSPTAEQSYYETVGAAGVPAISSGNRWPYLDKGTTDTANWNLPIFRYKSWGAGGGGNQIEFGWSYFHNWITRGMTGRYLQSMHWYRHIIDQAFPHSDGFHWSEQTGLAAGTGFPSRTSANSAQAFRNWIDTSHPHWYGLGDYYFLTGDELAKEQLLDGVRDYYVNTSHYATTGDLSTSRAVGMHLLGSARYAAFLADVSESATRTTVLTNATTLYNNQVEPYLCAESDETYLGCTFTPNPGIGHEDSQFGHSPLRGAHWSGGYISAWCGGSVVYRHNSSFPNAMLVQGLLELRTQKGSTWADYWTALDIAYGISQNALAETYHDHGTGRWDDSGFRANSLVDLESDCPAAPDDDDYEIGARVTEWQHFYVQYLVNGGLAWQDKFKTTVQKLQGNLGVLWQEMGSYQITQLIALVNNPGSTTLQTVPITGFTDLGSGNYRLQWTVPATAQSYRIKWSPKTIVGWLNFDVEAYTYGVTPTTNRPWFSTTNASSGEIPVPGTVGATQTTDISTGTASLASANFSVKAYVTNIPTRITWTSQSTPGDAPGANGWSTMFHNPVSAKILAFLIPNTTTNIWSMMMAHYETNTNDWTRLGGEAVAVGVCSDGSTSDVTPWPSNRHPYQNMAIDTSRNELHLALGVCSGTIPDDHWRYGLNSLTWTQISSNPGLTLGTDGNMVYDPDTDLLVFWGFNRGSFLAETWIYCLGNSVTGAQSTAGCSAVNAWQKVTTTASPTHTNGAYNVSYYDTVLDRVLAFTKSNSTGARQVWQYTVSTKTWADRNAVNVPSDTAPSTGESHVARITTGTFAGTYIFHRGTSSPTVTFVYDPLLNSFIPLTQLGGSQGPAAAAFHTWDSTADKIVARMAQSQVMWTATLQ